MLYASDVLGRQVVDADGMRTGKVLDIVVAIHEHVAQPPLVALVIRSRQSEPLIVPMRDVAVLIGPAVVLSAASATLAPLAAAEGLWLARDILDKELIDTDDARVVRVNDVKLQRSDGGYVVSGVAIGGLALARRLGIARLLHAVAALVHRPLAIMALPWRSVELIPGSHAGRLHVSAISTSLPAADVADIISDLTRVEVNRVVESMDVERLADTLEEVEPDFQASLIESMPDEKVADVLDEMAPDEAADLLAELPEERSEDLLSLMQKDEADDVRRLLTYPEDTAGGLMTTDFVAVRPHLTAEQTIATLRQTVREDETIYYVYVTDEQGGLLGVLSLQKLVLSAGSTPIREIMHDRVVAFQPLETQDDVAQAVAKYNLLAVPVVDEENRMLGIVTADDAIDKIVPTAWKKRLPRLYS